MTTATTLPQAERVHALFQVASEAAKLLRAGAFWIDMGAGGLAVVAIFHEHALGGFLPLLALLLVLLSFCLRLLADRWASRSHAGRRAAIRAHAAHRDLTAKFAGDCTADVSRLARMLVFWFKPQTLTEYYGPVSSPGRSRLRENYAHSAFFTWQALDLQMAVSWIFAALLGGATIAALYALSLDADTITHGRYLQVVVGVVFGSLLLRAIEYALRCQDGAVHTRSLYSELSTATTAAEVDDLTAQYDLARVGHPPLSSILFLLRRKRLDAEWEPVRDELPTIQEPGGSS